jgi:uncharacterized SAM-binding protein YcdF (DUF218 family)
MEYDVIVVLGGTKTPGYRLPKNRADGGIALYKKGHSPRIIVSGGEQARLISRYLEWRRIPLDSILVEDKSRNTVENAYFTKKWFLEPNNWKKPIIVTSEVHIPRTKYDFERILGKNYKPEFLPVSSGTGLSTLIRKHFIEKVGLLYTKFCLLGIKSGDHESVKKRYSAINYSKTSPVSRLKNLIGKIYSL